MGSSLSRANGKATRLDPPLSSHFLPTFLIFSYSHSQPSRFTCSHVLLQHTPRTKRGRFALSPIPLDGRISLVIGTMDHDNLDFYHLACLL